MSLRQLSINHPPTPCQRVSARAKRVNDNAQLERRAPGILWISEIPHTVLHIVQKVHASKVQSRTARGERKKDGPSLIEAESCDADEGDEAEVWVR